MIRNLVNKLLGNWEQKLVPLSRIEVSREKMLANYDRVKKTAKGKEVWPVLKANAYGGGLLTVAEIPANAAKLVSDYAVRVFKGIGGRGFARVDMMIRNNLPYVLEINTIPGLTPNSLLPKEAKVAGMSYPELLDKIIELALD